MRELVMYGSGLVVLAALIATIRCKEGIGLFMAVGFIALNLFLAVTLGGGSGGHEERYSIFAHSD